MAEKMKITLEGKQQLEAELHDLIHVVQPEVLEALAAARALGDLSENADYDAALEQFYQSVETKYPDLTH